MPSPKFMLCQDCLRVRPFTEAGHAGDEPCECGGDFCACLSCKGTAEQLAAGCRDARALSLRITGEAFAWSAENGLE